MRQISVTAYRKTMPLITLSKRSAVEPFHAMDILAEANRRRQAGRPVISMAVGQPSHPAPKAALEAAETALKHGRIGYTDALGLRELREAISAHYRLRHQAIIDPARIAVTTGSSQPSTLPSWRCSMPVMRSRSQARLSRLPQHLEGAWAECGGSAGHG